MSGHTKKRGTSSTYLVLRDAFCPILTFVYSFGFLDGVSQPAVQGVDTTTNPGQETVRQGIILLGRKGDAQKRPSWALDGSFLAFRYLPQLVPEFNAFLGSKPVPGVNAEQLGARLVGRWKSGRYSQTVLTLSWLPDTDDANRSPH